MPVHIQPRSADGDIRLVGSEKGAGKTRGRKDGERPRARKPVTIRHPWYLSLKTAAEFVFALVLCVLALPIIGLAALLVKLTSHGPAFYTQTRVGRYGQHFTILKLRTMVDKCESLTGPRWSIPGDPRITLVGHILRATHLDELPQLINVLRSEMSIIGPRPERPEFLPDLERNIPGYRDRLLVRPGVTGLAQVQLPADTDLHSVRRKLAYDLFYVERVSPWLDLRIFACTILYAAGVPFWIGGKLWRVPDSSVVEQARQEAPVPQTPRRVRMAA